MRPRVPDLLIQPPRPALWRRTATRPARAFSPDVIDQYCHCYANGIADRLSDDDLKALATMERSARARKLQPMVEAASAPCLKALPKAN
jgi:hypothetical protein